MFHKRTFKKKNKTSQTFLSLFFIHRSASLHVSMNNGLSFISSSVTITTVSCVSTVTLQGSSVKPTTTVTLGRATPSTTTLGSSSSSAPSSVYPLNTVSIFCPSCPL